MDTHADTNTDTRVDTSTGAPATTDELAPAPLTPRQEEVLDVIRRSIAERGFPPTLREIGAELGFTSINAAHDHLCALERKGYIRRDGLKSRAIVLLNTPTTVPATAHAAADPLRAALERIAAFDGREGAWMMGPYFARLAREALASPQTTEVPTALWVRSP
jgi:SOS-response transcriptional repressor LexA